MSLRLKIDMAEILKKNLNNLDQHCSCCVFAIYPIPYLVLVNVVFPIWQSKRFLFLSIFALM